MDPVDWGFVFELWLARPRRLEGDNLGTGFLISARYAVAAGDFTRIDNAAGSVRLRGSAIDMPGRLFRQELIGGLSLGMIALEQDAPASLRIPPTSSRPPPGDAWTSWCYPPHVSEGMPLSGRVAAHHNLGFALDLDEPRTVPEAHGAPVVVDGAVAGIVSSAAEPTLWLAVGFDALPTTYRLVSSGVAEPASMVGDIDLSVEARSILDYAIALRADVAIRPDHVLLAGMARARQIGLERESTAVLYLSLGEERGSRLDEAAELLGATIPTSSPPRGPMGSDVADFVRTAARFERHVAGGGIVQPRHLMAAAITTGSLDPGVVDALGQSQEALRRTLRNYLRAHRPDESPRRWDEILGTTSDAPTSLAGGMSVDLVRPDEGIALGDDHLNVATYVTMLATVIADRKTPMPLSIGLFGEWGSGKSYFMGLLRQGIDDLSTKARQDASLPYHHDIVQIGFNAWHYSDANLWASLGDEIFEQLAGPDQTASARRDALREELGALLQRRKELEASTAEAKVVTARLQGQADMAARQRDVKAKELVTAVLASETLGHQLQTAFARLGVRGDPLAQGRLLADEMRKTGAEVASWRRTAADRRWWPAALVATAALLVLAGAALVPASVREWFVRGGLAGLASVVAGVVAVMERARSGARLLRQVTDEVRARVPAQEPTAQDAAMAALRQAQADEQVLRAQVEEVVGRVGELGRELAQLSPGQRLYGFITERAASGDYQSQLGLVSTVRKDFEQLVELLADWATRPPGEDGAHRPIDRIVLYIDDLDRCSPEQVVDVLQAVHLLLALDLFVVVVGVDPRWLLRSLRRQYHDALAGTPTGTRDQAWWQSTPQDYLEKIFNIPFVLPTMDEEAFGLLMRSIAQETTASPARRPEKGEVTRAERPTSPTAPRAEDATVADTSDQAEGRSSVDREAGSEVAAAVAGLPVPPATPLTDDELSLIDALWPLVRTPRAGKRLFNLYRMLRSTRDLSDASQFLATDHRAVAQLLGLLTAHPALLGPIVRGLLRQPDDGSWADFVAALAPVEVDGRIGNGVLDTLAPADVAAWSALAAGLEPALALAKEDDLRPYRLWAPRIARFSFLLSPFATDGSEPGN